MSLTSGALPIALEALALTALLIGIGRRSRSWWLRPVTIAVLAGVLLAVAVRGFVKYQGWSEEAASLGSVLGVVATGFAAAMLILAWPGSRWWRWWW